MRADKKVQLIEPCGSELTSQTYVNQPSSYRTKNLRSSTSLHVRGAIPMILKGLPTVD